MVPGEASLPGLNVPVKRPADGPHPASGEETNKEAKTRRVKPNKKQEIKLPEGITIEIITKDNIADYKSLITLLLPMPYSEKFWKDIVSDEVINSVSLIAIYAAQTKKGTTAKPKVVAGIQCRVLNAPVDANANKSNGTDLDEKPCLYVSTLGTLAPYRGMGLATELLRRVISTAMQDYGVATVSAHVWEANEDAIAWYEKLGFKQKRKLDRYYTRLKPTGAYIVERRCGPMDLLSDLQMKFGDVMP